jgi:uncharacterized protein YkwD
MKPSSLFFTSLVFFCLVSFIPRDKTDLRQDILKYTNRFRESKNLPALVMNSELNEIAEKHTLNMATGRVPFGHQGFPQRSELIRKKLKCWNVAENVSFGINSGKDAVELWETSPGHRLNMLGDYKYIGIGTAVDRSGRKYFTQIFAH